MKIKITLIVIIILFSFFNSKNGILADTKSNDYEINLQQYSLIFDWLNNNTEKDSVVYANSDFSNLIPVYTHNNVYYSRFANLFFIKDQEVFERFIINNYWEDFNEQFILDKQRFIWGVHYIDEYNHNMSKNKLRKLLFLPIKNYDNIPKQKMDDFNNLVFKIQSSGIEDYLFNYKVDYLIWDTKKDPHWDLNKLNNIKLLYKIGYFYVYTFNF